MKVDNSHPSQETREKKKQLLGMSHVGIQGVINEE